ncbi:MAG: AlpA family phage regulatory protein [Proteobacteria bacterium]|nr:AlpA family phage regulatory protein [Pseudomonadota bacterium]
MTKKTLLPETGFLRLPAILQIFPIGKSTWWAGVKNGKYPKPIKLSKRTTAWRVEDIKNLIEGYKKGGENA